MTSIMRGFYEAVIPLSNWNILIETDETGKTAERFIGLNDREGLGHLSEKISHFDEEAKLALIETDRLYVLHGVSGRPDNKAIVILVERIGFKRTVNLFRHGHAAQLKFRYPMS